MKMSDENGYCWGFRSPSSPSPNTKLPFRWAFWLPESHFIPCPQYSETGTFKMTYHTLKMTNLLRTCNVMTLYLSCYIKETLRASWPHCLEAIEDLVPFGWSSSKYRLVISQIMWSVILNWWYDILAQWRVNWKCFSLTVLSFHALLEKMFRSVKNDYFWAFWLY